MQMRLWWRLWCCLEEPVFGCSLESVSGFGVGAFGRNLVSVALMFSHLTYFLQEFCKFCDLNAICADDVAISCVIQHITVISRQHERSYYASWKYKHLNISVSKNLVNYFTRF
jgi:hypothetical protein